MPRRIFPAGTVTNTTGAALRLEFYPTSTSIRREVDMWTVDGSNNLVERIANGIVLTDATGAYSAFAGPDDVDVLYALPNNTSSRTTLTATGTVAGGTTVDAATFVQWNGTQLTIGGSPIAVGGIVRARPAVIDPGWKLKAVGAGGASTQYINAVSNLPVYKSLTASSGESAWAESPPIGHFDLTVAPNVVAQTGTTTILAVVPHYSATPSTPLLPTLVTVKYSFSSSQTWTVEATGTGGTVATVGTFSQTGNVVTAIRVRRDVYGWRVDFSRTDGTTTSYSHRHVDVLSTHRYAMGKLILGKLDSGTGTHNLEMQVTSLTLQPLDSHSRALYGQTVGTLRGGNRLHDAILNTEVDRMLEMVQVPGGIFPYKSFGVPGYLSFGIFAWDFYFRLPFFRDIGYTQMCRENLLNVFGNPQTGGRLPAIINATGPTDPGSGRVWSQACFAQMAAMLSHDGDCSWFTYSVLQDHLTWWETNRKTARGLFLMDDGQELGWDGAIATNPSGVTTVEPNRFEPIHLNCMMYGEYLAMQGIANQLGNTADAATYATKAATLRTKIRTLLYSSGWFYSYDTLLTALSPHRQGDAVYALFYGVATQVQAQAVRDILMNPTNFLANYGVTTLDKTDAAYLPSGYTNPTAWQTNWNGPIWEPMNYMAAIGLNRYGFTVDALDVAVRGTRLYGACAGSSRAPVLIGEWHHPDTGAPDTQGHLPWVGWGCLPIRTYLDLSLGHDPYKVTTTGTVRETQAYTVPA